MPTHPAFALWEAMLSGLLAGKVWHSNLDAELKPLAATLADIADDDGSNIYPSILFVAWRLGRDTSTVDRGLKRLRDMGILEVIEQGGGMGRTTEYRMIERKFPQREPWEEFKNNRTVRSLTTASTDQTTASTPLNNRVDAVGPVSNPSLPEEESKTENLENRPCSKCGAIGRHRCGGYKSRKQQERDKRRAAQPKFIPEREQRPVYRQPTAPAPESADLDEDYPRL